MKTEDLMIGDWIRLKDDSLSYEESCMKITFLSNSTMCSLKYTRTNTQIGLRKPNEDWLCPVFVDDIEPIPLTPEILKKNGFINSYIDLSLNKDSVYKYNHFYTGNSVIVDMKSNKLMVKYENDIWMNLPYNRTIYVHELQHVLKHCEIKKEIII